MQQNQRALSSGRSGSTLLLLIALLLTTLGTHAEVAVINGPTPILRGDALGEQDITVRNEWFAVSFAVDTPPPWGVARGGILDIALITDGRAGYDIASLVDFMPNRWSSWPTTYQRVSVEQSGEQEVLIRTRRDWGEVELETTFLISQGDRKIHIVTDMTNAGSSALEDLASGYVVWPDGGSLFGVPGLAGEYSGYESAANARWSAAYGDNWVLGLHAPFSEFVDYGGRDRYQSHTLQPGESRRFEAWLQIENDGSLAPLVHSEINQNSLPFGRVTGTVQNVQGNDVARPAVVISQNGKPYSWTIGDGGRYECLLPAGDYQMYATAAGHAQGATKSIRVTAGSDTTVDFADIQPPGTLRVDVANALTGKQMDARISIKQGYQQLISHFGRNAFFTELNNPGKALINMPPGQYTLEISAGGGFTTQRQRRDILISSGQDHSLRVEIEPVTAPSQHNWFSTDLHHHSDVLDGFTEAQFVLRSQLAAGLDVAFLSDHDSVENNASMQRLADSRSVLFIAGTELSPSWAHFNAFPVDDFKTVDIDTGRATVQEVFAEARRMGADLIEANHPYSRYGYFESLEQQITVDGVTASAVPGGVDFGFDLAEIVPDDLEANSKTVQRVWQLWNEGHKIYLAAGSDVHDVWLSESGSARTYVFVDSELTTENIVASLKNGRAFASAGPLVYPDILFGSTVTATEGEPLTLNYRLSAVSGLASAKLIERGNVIGGLEFETNPVEAPFSIEVQPSGNTWYSLVVEDANGKIAYTNPVWVVASTEQDKPINANRIIIWATLFTLVIIILAMRIRD